MEAACLHHLHLADEPAQTSLGHVGGGIPRNVALDVVQFAQELVLDGVELGLAQRPALLPLLHVMGVIAPVLLETGAAHLPDAIDYRVQEVAVVADDEQRAVPRGQRALQPLDGLDVQMVGRLVQDEQVGTLQEQTGQEGARLLPAAEMGQRDVPIGAAEAQALQRLADAHFVVIAAGPLEGLLNAAVLGQQCVGMAAVRGGVVGHAMFQPAQLGFLGLQAAEDREHLVVHGVVPTGKRLHGFLAQIADTRVPGRVHVAPGGRIQPGEHAQQRGLADAVGADQPDLAVVGNGGVEPDENVEVAVRLGEIVERKNRHGCCRRQWPIRQV